MTPKLRKLVLWVGSVIVLVIVILFATPAMMGDSRLHSKARKEWKEKAIVDIKDRRRVGQAITNEIAALRAESTRTDEGWWVGTNVLVMTNGEHLVYSQVCSKRNPNIHDLFIAHGSNGKWYYSTYHFCVGMVDLLIQECPGSLAAFTEKYFAREFDGKSDACLEKTWPPTSNR